MGRHSDARERLIDAVWELWHTRSYADVGAREICDHAQVQKGSFYHFFVGVDLALAVIDEQWRVQGLGQMAPILTGPLPPLERLTLFLERGLEEQVQLKEATGATVGCSFGNLVVELATVDDVLRDRLAGLFDDWAGLLQRALDDAVAAGDLPEIDTGQAARAMLAFIEGLGVLIKAKDDPLAAADLLPFALRLAGPIRRASPGRRPRPEPTRPACRFPRAASTRKRPFASTSNRPVNYSAAGLNRENDDDDDLHDHRRAGPAAQVVRPGGPVPPFMVILDVAIVNVALPTIQVDLGFSQKNLQVVSAYALTFGGLLCWAAAPPTLGRRRLFIVGLAVFAAASLLAASRGRSRSRPARSRASARRS